MTEPLTLPGQDQEQQERRCHGTRRDGTPCTVPPALLYVTADEDGVALWTCNSHDPRPDVQAARQLDRQRGSLNSTARMARRLQRLDVGALGPLRTVSDAERQLALLSAAVAEGRLSSADANASVRAVLAWIRARDLGLKESSLRALQEQIDQLRHERKPMGPR